MSAKNIEDIVGLEIGGYRIEGYLGSGKMADVFSALHLVLKRMDALKVFKTGSVASILYRYDLRIQKEIEMMSKIEHPHVVPIFGAGFGETPYLAMKLYKTTLMRQMEMSKPPSAKEDFIETINMFMSLADGLACIHSNGIIHRDIKTSNIFLENVNGFWNPAIGDFGIARMQQRTPEDEDSKISLEGEILGTPEYMSPEQTFPNADLDARSDIYSLGVTLYEAITGGKPIGFRAGESSHEILSRVREQRPTTPRVINKQVPSQLQSIILRTLEKDPQKRYQSTSELLGDLDLFITEGKATAPKYYFMRIDDQRIRVQSWISRNKALAAAMLLGATTIAGASIYTVRHIEYMQSAEFVQVMIESDALAEEGKIRALTELYSRFEREKVIPLLKESFKPWNVDGTPTAVKFSYITVDAQQGRTWLRLAPQNLTSKYSLEMLLSIRENGSEIDRQELEYMIRAASNALMASENSESYSLSRFNPLIQLYARNNDQKMKEILMAAADGYMSRFDEKSGIFSPLSKDELGRYNQKGVICDNLSLAMMLPLLEFKLGLSTSDTERRLLALRVKSNLRQILSHNVKPDGWVVKTYFSAQGTEEEMKEDAEEICGNQAYLLEGISLMQKSQFNGYVRDDSSLLHALDTSAALLIRKIAYKENTNTSLAREAYALLQMQDCLSPDLAKEARQKAVDILIYLSSADNLIADPDSKEMLLTYPKNSGKSPSSLIESAYYFGQAIKKLKEIKK